MNAIATSAAAMILAGACILAVALVFASRIVAQLPFGTTRRWWSVLRALVALFILGYAASIMLLPRSPGPVHLVVGTVFLFGSVFVLLVCRLMLTTVTDIRRIATLEVENVTDPLLGIYNRRYMEQRLAEEVARANRYDLPLSLCIIDIDRFKRINDNFGHPIGDEMLKKLCSLVREKVREVDLFARYGGEEFVVILPSTGAREAHMLAERLRSAVEGGAITVDSVGGHLEIACTVSIGVATAAKGQRDGKQLLREADQALYQAKASGRNRVEAYRAEVRAA